MKHDGQIGMVGKKQNMKRGRKGGGEEKFSMIFIFAVQRIYSPDWMTVSRRASSGGPG